MILAKLFKIEQYQHRKAPLVASLAYYQIIMIEGQADLSVDLTSYRIAGKNLIFLAPYQHLRIDFMGNNQITIFKFHGDFYCIEYHSKEVACNGVLFNNIYEQPYFGVSPEIYAEIGSIIQRTWPYEDSRDGDDLSISRTYLQLIIALANKEKRPLLQQPTKGHPAKDVLDFRIQLEKNFIQKRSVAFYANNYGLSVGAFSKKVKQAFNKPPSRLLNERLVLEAKRRLHLTYKSIKEISNELGFSDEFYFSRFFKKEVGISPSSFRNRTGISISAK